MPSRSTIAKLGHITRELKLNRALSDKSLQRLIKVLTILKDGFSAPEQIDIIIDNFNRGKTINELTDELKFWVYECIEWGNAGVLEIEFGPEE